MEPRRGRGERLETITSLRSSKFQSLETNLELSKSRVMTGPRKDLLHHISMMKLVLETWEKGPVPLL